MAKFCSECGNPLGDSEAFCPKCGAKVGGGASAPAGGTEDSEQGGKKKLLMWVAAIVVVFFGFMAFGSDSKSGGKSDDKSSPAIVVKAEEVLDDYVRDQGTAETKYKDKKVSITGRIKSKNQFNNSNDFALMMATKHAAGRRYAVLVDVPAEKVEIVNKAEEGKFVTVQGTCIGVVKQEDPTYISIQIKADQIKQ